MAVTTKEHPALQLLNRAHSPITSSQIHREKIQNRPLLLRPSSPDPKEDARRQRQKARLQKSTLTKRKSKKPKPLTAKQKRESGIYEIPKSQRKYEIYVPVWKLWCGYMREVLGVQGREGAERWLGAMSVGPLLASAEYHGAMMEVVRSRCVGRVGITGIVVKDTKFTFEVITKGNEIKTVPKEYTVFRFEVPLEAAEGEVKKPLIFELHGSQFENRPADRANRKFKQHIDPNL